MTVTYDITTNVGKVRLMVGDTDTTDNVFTDEEIQVFLTIESDNLYLAAADVLGAWASKYGANADSEHIGDYAYTQKIVDKMMALAKSYREKADSEPSCAWAEMGVTDFNTVEIIWNRNMRSG